MQIDRILANRAQRPDVAAAAENAREQLGKEDFLRLLTVQLRYQDPMNPMENTDFIAQMAQFSSLEQLQNMNQSLDRSVGSDERMHTAVTNNMVTALVGKTVEVPTAEISYDGQRSTSMSYRIGEGARSAKFQVSDGRGQIVREFDLDVSSSYGQIQWDGISRFDTEVPAGVYRALVVAEDAIGQPVKADALHGVRVQAVRYDGHEALIWADDREFSFADLHGVLNEKNE